jgi:GntR family transcriptional regulator/MocR family aminotransferase
MDIFLDGRGPRYGQLVRALRVAIASGRLPRGSRLPASRQLAAQLGVSRTTVVAAFQQLQLAGLIEAVPGSGNYVSKDGNTSQQPLAMPSIADPQSEYSKRLRTIEKSDDCLGRRRHTARFDFQFETPVLNVNIASVWAREIARCAPYVSHDLPPIAGLESLREALCRYLRRARGILCEPDDVLICVGDRQALSLSAKVLFDKGDVVVMEDPHCSDTRATFEINGATVIGVPIDDDGLVVADIPSRPAKAVFVTTARQYPTGVEMSLPRREQLLSWSDKCGAWIIECEIGGEFRTPGPAIPALRAMDSGERVIYVGSFSKTLFPSVRVGYVVMPPGLRQDFLAAKWAEDRGNSAIEQFALARLIDSGGYERHLQAVEPLLRERREGLAQALTDNQEHFEITPCRNGMHIYTKLNGVDSDRSGSIIREAANLGIGLYSADACYYQLHRDRRASLMMGFSGLPVTDLREGVRLLCGLLENQNIMLSRATAR